MLVTQIPDARKHLVGDFGAYGHRFRGHVREIEAAKAASQPAQATEDAKGKVAEGEGASTSLPPVEPVSPAEPGLPEAKRRSSCFRPDEGRRVLKEAFEVDLLPCPRCKVEMRVTVVPDVPTRPSSESPRTSSSQVTKASPSNRRRTLGDTGAAMPT